MCGLCGFVDSTGVEAKALEKIVLDMNQALFHRGPDGGDSWVDAETGVALGHRRLSIIDLSPLGAQPMVSTSGRYIIVYNGEIYNFGALRNDLESKGHSFRGHSDTEVLLSAIEEWGLEKALQKFNGMFALALWDRKGRVLHLARDRMGKKPLYYGWAGHAFLFASELKAFHRHPSFNPAIDRNVLALFCRHNYVPAPWSIYKGVYKLPAASYVTIPFDGKSAVKRGADLFGEARKYWDIKAVAEDGARHPFDMEDDQAIEALDDILGIAVGSRMISDVPLGAFLSGGIDSSLVVAMMQKQSTRPVKTFSIGFEESSYNEAQDAKKIAAHLGTDHTEFYVTADEAQSIIPQLPEMFDEPFADPSQIPTWHVSHLARQHVTVALSGDGGDEGFAGYGRYLRFQKLMMTPSLLRRAGGVAFSVVPEDMNARLSRLSHILRGKDCDSVYRQIMSYWQNPAALVRDATESLSPLTDPRNIPDMADPVDRISYWDIISYLTDDVLVKVDRASMFASLEARAPLLDYKVIEFSRSLPMEMKVRDGRGKWILRELLSRYMPLSLFDRPKQGFGIPHGEWICGPLRDWAENLLDEKTLEEQGFFDAAQVRQKWSAHCNGAQDWSYHLWSILMFQAWHGRWGKAS